MSPLFKAEHILQDLGIADPADIDLSAIAHHLGARIKICQLDGCEARIIGVNNRAIIRVSDAVGQRRQRFSIAHELGHWCLHRGSSLLCMAEDIGNANSIRPQREQSADRFAADLILPWHIFKPIARKYKKLDFTAVEQVSEVFKASRTATALRFIDMRHTPALLVCHGPKGRLWFRRSGDVPDHWFPQDQLDPSSYAFDLLFGKAKAQSNANKVAADTWFHRHDAGRFEISEHTIKIADDKVLSILSITNPRMLD